MRSPTFFFSDLTILFDLPISWTSFLPLTLNDGLISCATFFDFEAFICHLWIILFMKHNHHNQNEKKKTNRCNKIIITFINFNACMKIMNGNAVFMILKTFCSQATHITFICPMLFDSFPLDTQICKFQVN